MSDTSEVCRAFRNTGRCKYGEECKYAHSDGEPIEPPPRGPCFEWAETNSCKYGDNCRFAHGEDDNRPRTRPQRKQTKSNAVCFQWRDNGECEHGDDCRFSHSNDAEEAAPKKTRAPKARENRESKPRTRAPKDDTCFSFRDTGTCVHGDDCRFRHGDNDSRDRKSGRDSAPKKFNVGTRVYVGNLSWQTSWQDLKDFFRSSGTVVYTDVMKRSDGKSQGCGIVEFSSNEEALDAITNLNDAELDGRMIFIREDREDYKVNNKPTTRTFVARPRSSESRRDDRRDDRRSYDGHDDRRDDRGSSRRDNRDNDNDTSWGRSNRKDRNTNTNNNDTDSLTIGKRVFVSNLSWDTRWQELKDHFKQVGTVVRADVLTQRDGRSSGSGVIEFESPHEAMKAISVVSNTELDGRMITVREDREEFSK